MSTNEHCLLRELREQPRAVRDTIDAERIEIDRLARLLKRKRIHFLGMGSSYFASLYANYLFADLTHRTVSNHLASEFIHYPSTIAASEVSVVLSQSGESIEIVKAVRLLKKQDHFVVGITNAPRSTLARLSDRVVLTHAGKERASSTKTFAATLAILYCLIVAIAARSKEISGRKEERFIERMIRMTRTLDASLESWSDDVRYHSSKLANCRAAIILARGPTLPAALQGALLLKEVAKIPAEGMSSGEFSHGPVEAVSRRISVVVLGGGRTSKLQYLLALRSKSLHGRTLMVAPSKVRGVESIGYGEIDENLAIFPCVAILELVAYHTALKKRLNPDHFKFIRKVTTRE